jgi:hypothetical protein
MFHNVLLLLRDESTLSVRKREIQRRSFRGEREIEGGKIRM